jgi:hypothetical protein
MRARATRTQISSFSENWYLVHPATIQQWLDCPRNELRKMGKSKSFWSEGFRLRFSFKMAATDVACNLHWLPKSPIKAAPMSH